MVAAALLNSRGDYLNVGAVDDLLKPAQTGSCGRRSRHARKEHVRKMADEGGAFILNHSKRGNFTTERALPTIHTAKQLSEVVDMSQGGVSMQYPELWDKVAFTEFMSTSDARKDNYDTIAEH